MERFLDTFIYGPDAVLIDAVTRLDADAKEIEGVFDTTRPLSITEQQRGDPALHPRHVSAPEMLQVTGILGCMYAYFVHGIRWDEGWVGFGSRIHRADFRELARLGPPLRLLGTETRSRVGTARIMLRFAFEFRQEDRVVYRGDQSALFLFRPTYE